jgi:hypothetical protein
MTAERNAMVEFRFARSARQQPMALGVANTAMGLLGKAARAERFPDETMRRLHIE